MYSLSYIKGLQSFVDTHDSGGYFWLEVANSKGVVDTSEYPVVRA